MDFLMDILLNVEKLLGFILKLNSFDGFLNWFCWKPEVQEANKKIISWQSQNLISSANLFFGKLKRLQINTGFSYD